MNSPSWSNVLLRKTGAVSRMKSFQNWPGSSARRAAGESHRPLLEALSLERPANDSSTMKTTRCPRRRSTSPMPTQLFVGPKRPPGRRRSPRRSAHTHRAEPNRVGVAPPVAVDFGSETEAKETTCRAQSASRPPASRTATAARGAAGRGPRREAGGRDRHRRPRR
jgi:hypothetical protein